MDPALVVGLALGMLVAAFFYAAVGHGGASAYLALMALAGVAPAEMRPVALALNIAVAAVASFNFWRAGHFRWHLFWPFAVASVPAAYLGGAIALPGAAYKVLVGLVLCYAGWQLWSSARAEEDARPVRPLPLGVAAAIGAAIGALSGLTGVGGGIFLSPLLLLARWAEAKQTSAVAAPFILVNSMAALAAVFARNPSPMPDYLWWLMAAVLAGGAVGARHGSRRLANPLIRRLLAAVLGIAGAKMFMV